MFILKGCPKCHGDLAADSSTSRIDNDVNVTCIQCGYDLRPDEQSGILGRLLKRQPRLRPAPVYIHARR